MIDLIGTFGALSRILGGGCDDNNHHESKRVKSPTRSSRFSDKPIITSHPRLSSRPILRYDESRDDDTIIARKKSLLDIMVSGSEESNERDSAMGGSNELLLEDETPLAIMERGRNNNNIHHHHHSASNSSDDSASYESIGTIANVRKRGLEQVGKYLPTLITQQHHNTSNNYSSNNKRNEQVHELPKLLEMVKGYKFKASCPMCSGRLRYAYISSANNLVLIDKGKESSNDKLRNLMPPFCNRCQAHLLFDHDQTKKLMITNVERWLACNMNDESRGKILFISSTPTNNNDASDGISPRVLIELTPRLSSRGGVSFTFNEVDVEERHIFSVESSLSETVEVLSPQNKGSAAQYYTNRDQVSRDHNNERATMDDDNDIQLVNTESEEREILQRYSLTRAVATKSISKHLKKGYELTTDLCDRCQMPMMQLGDRAIYCIVCPVIDKEAKRNARRKRKIIQNNHQSLPTTHYVPTLSSDSQTTEESRPKLVLKSSQKESSDLQQQFKGNSMYRLTALEEGMGFIWSPRNQDVVNLAVSSCMSMDDNESTAHKMSDDAPLVYHSQLIAEQGSSGQVQHRQLLDQPSYSASYPDNLSNQYSVGVECTYSVHQMYLSQHPSMDGVTRTNSTSPSNIMQQASSISETRCPRNLPSGEMIWHPEDQVQSDQYTNAEYNKDTTLKDPMQTSHTANDFFIPKESFEPQTVVAASSEYNNLNNLAGPELFIGDEQVSFPESAVENNEDGISRRVIEHESISKPIEKKSIATRIASLSSSMKAFAEETRGDESTQRTTRDDVSDLGCAHQKSFDGPLLTPDMIICPVHADEEARDANIQHASSFTVPKEQPCERERRQTVRVFGMVVAQSPRAQKQKGDTLPPLFPSPKASTQRQEAEKEQNLAGDVQLGDRELAVMPQESVVIKEEKVSLLFPPPQDALPMASISNRDIVSPSLQGGDTGMNIEKSLEVEKQQPILFEPSQKAVDPPGKRLSKRREGNPIDPPAFAGTPKRGNIAKPKRKQKGYHSSVDKPAHKPIDAFGSNKPRSTENRSSQKEPKSKLNSISSYTKEEESLMLTIPTWVDDEMNSPLKTSRSLGDCSVQKLIQQIDDLEADFGSIVALMPGSSATTLNTIKSEEKNHRRKAKVNGPKILEISDAETASQAKLDNDASDDSVLDNLTQQIRKVHLQIEQMESSADLDCDEILGTASQEEMLELINRLNNAAQSLKTFD